MSLHHVNEPKARIVAGMWQVSFLEAIATGEVRVATTEYEEAFAARRRDVITKVRLSKSTDTKQKLTASVSTHLARIKTLLRPV